MKVLFFTYDFPYPTISGGKTRAYNLLKYASEGIDFTLFSFIREDFKIKNIEKIKELGIKNIQLFKRKKLRDPKNLLTLFDPKGSIFKRLYYRKDIALELEKIVHHEKIDLIHFESFYTAFYINDSLKKFGTRLILGTENIENKIYMDFAKHLSPFLLKPIYYWEALKIRKEEEALFNLSDVNIAVTNNEADYIKRNGNRCFVVENGIDLNFFKYKEKQYKNDKVILFVGNFSYFPNLDAVNSFYHNVFVKIEDDKIFFKIIGKGADKLSFAKNKNVLVQNYIDDIRNAYYMADIFISPIRFGGGTNFKILEAMACGTPVVAFYQHAKEIGAKDKEEILYANDFTQFKDQLVTLIIDSKLRNKIIQNARIFVQDNCSWNIIGKKLNHIWKTI